MSRKSEIVSHFGGRLSLGHSPRAPVLVGRIKRQRHFRAIRGILVAERSKLEGGHRHERRATIKIGAAAGTGWVMDAERKRKLLWDNAVRFYARAEI